jgi:hypothetical protein
MILIRETTSGPAQIGNLYILQSFDNIIPDPISVRNRAVFTHPDAAIYTMAKVLTEMPVNVFADLKLSLVGINYELISDCLLGK